MRYAANMPKLKKNFPALLMHGFRYLLPSSYLFAVINPGRLRIALALWTDLGGFGNNQASSGALSIVARVQVGGHVVRSSAAARQGRYHDPVAKLN